MSLPELWLIAGPNGAGKTTITRTHPISGLIAGVRFLNPDVRTLELLNAAGFESFAEGARHPELLRALNIQAAEESQAELEHRIRNGEAVAVETVLSTPKYQSVITEVIRAGGRCFLIYVALSSPAVSAARVRRRVGEGGHDVPAEKLHERWGRSLKMLPWFAARAHRFWVYDNSNSEASVPAELIATGGRGHLTLFNPDAIPALTESLTRSGLFKTTRLPE